MAHICAHTQPLTMFDSSKCKTKLSAKLGPLKKATKEHFKRVMWIYSVKTARLIKINAFFKMEKSAQMINSENVITTKHS